MLINNNCYSCIVSNFGKYLSIPIKIESLNITHSKNLTPPTNKIQTYEKRTNNK